MERSCTYCIYVFWFGNSLLPGSEFIKYVLSQKKVSMYTEVVLLYVMFKPPSNQVNFASLFVHCLHCYHCFHCSHCLHCLTTIHTVCAAYIATLQESLHWLHLICLQSEFANESSNCQPEQMYSQIGCIWMVFFPEWVLRCLLKLPWTDAKSHWLHLCISLQSEVSNASSNGLPEQMQSRIGCICMVYLMSECSDVSSNGLPEQMHSHIACICVVFLLSEFSDASTNCMLE